MALCEMSSFVVLLMCVLFIKSIWDKFISPLDELQFFVVILKLRIFLMF